MSYARKYKFWDWISALPRQQRSQRLNELATATGVSRRTLNTWVDAELSASLDVSFEAVLTISRLLGQDPLAALNVAAPTTSPVATAQVA